MQSLNVLASGNQNPGYAVKQLGLFWPLAFVRRRDYLAIALRTVRTIPILAGRSYARLC
jgi:hypothetical protein